MPKIRIIYYCPVCGDVKVEKEMDTGLDLHAHEHIDDDGKVFIVIFKMKEIEYG